MTRTKKTEKIATFPGDQNLNSSNIITLENPESQETQGIQEEKTDNYFQSIEEFTTFVKDNFIKGSGIAPELFAECVDFVSEQEFTLGGDVETPIHTRLDWSAYKRSWKKKQPLFAAFLKNEDGTDWQAIVSIYDKSKDRPYVYLAPNANGDRVFLPPVPKTIRQKISQRYGVEVPLDGSFWEWLETAKIPRIPTEGGKKGLSLLSHGYAGLAMYGCSCGGQEVPVPDLARFNSDGSTWLLALDRDSKISTKRKVNASKKRLSAVLSEQAVVCIDDIVWTPEQGKGVDDLIVNQGSGAFDLAYSLAYARASKQSKSGGYEDSGTEKRKTPIQSEIALMMAKKFQNVLAFNGEKKAWMYYSLETIGVWTEISDETIEALIYKAVLSEGFECFSSSFISGVVKLLRSELFTLKWDEPEATQYLPFEDGVLEIATTLLLPHSPKYKLTWQLPRPYKHDGGWDNINQFINDATCCDKQAKRILLCFCNAVLKGRHDLQKFLYILGRPGSGKGTFIRLLVSLIGKSNIVSTDLKTWNTNNFEQARAYRKRLVVFPEQIPYYDDIGKFLSLTGEDLLRLERKGKDAKDDFPYTGMTLMAGNIYAFSGQTLNAVRRRELLVLFNNSVPIVKNLEPLFAPELSAFTAYLLTIPDEEVTAVLTGKGHDNLLDSWEARMRTDPIAHWANYHVVFDPLATTFMGSNKNECSDGREAVTFYGSYANFCQKAGNNPLGANHFSPNFREMLSTIWGWHVEKIDSNKGSYLKGVRLRDDRTDDHIPSFDMTLRQKSDIPEKSGLRSGEPSGEPVTNLNTLQDNDSRDSGEPTPETSTKNSSSSVVDQQYQEKSDRTVSHADWCKDPIFLHLELPCLDNTVKVEAEPKARILDNKKKIIGYECSVTWYWPDNSTTNLSAPLIEDGMFEELASRITGQWEERHRKENKPIEPWRPNTNRKAMYGGELVDIVGFQRVGNKFQIQYPSGRFEWVKASKLSEPRKS
jgi:putative DNA primase/helicase